MIPGITRPHVDQLRKDDYVFCYWIGSEGRFAWLVERGKQLFFFEVEQMRAMYARHWAYSGNQNDIDIVRNIMGCLGYIEYPVYAPLRNADNSLDYLKKNLLMFENTINQIVKNRTEKDAETDKVKDIKDAEKRNIE